MKGVAQKALKEMDPQAQQRATEVGRVALKGLVQRALLIVLGQGHGQGREVQDREGREVQEATEVEVGQEVLEEVGQGHTVQLKVTPQEVVEGKSFSKGKNERC